MEAKTKQLISMKSINLSNIDEKIEAKEQEVKDALNDEKVLFYIPGMFDLAKDIEYLAALQEARVIMTSSVNYKIYEKEGKPCDYQEWLENVSE